MYVDYDTYAKMSPLKRVRTLHDLSPENLAELVKTHLQRYLEENRAQLNDEQIRFIEENITWIRPEHYLRPRANEQEIDRHSKEAEARLHQLFTRDDVVKLHFGAFKNSGEIPNPIARALVRQRPTTELRETYYDIATLPTEELRARRPDLPEILGRYYRDLPEDFWTFAGDEDVPHAASRAYSITGPRRSGAPPQPDPPY